MEGSAGNVTLQRALGWEDAKYWPIRDRLVDRGELELGRGRGGSVSLVPADSPPEAAGAIAEYHRTPAIDEASLYEPVARVLRGDWARDMRFRSHLVEVTARQGRRDTGGTWTRPDLVVAALRVFPHVPGKFFDLITFEIKALNGIDITAVFEAVAHRRAATQAYLWLHAPSDSQSPELKQLLGRIHDESRRQGTGLIVATDPADYSTWDLQLRATRQDPDPESMNEFISQQISGLPRGTVKTGQLGSPENRPVVKLVADVDAAWAMRLPRGDGQRLEPRTTR
ncbi:MAG: hypothetical protein K8J09_11670, partial [Planctomycetes bacterium]|nr:hypothetical protein [Planctomycetota bacterium]